MNRTIRSRWTLLGAMSLLVTTLTGVATVSAIPAATHTEDSVSQWSSDLWNAAIAGRMDTVEGFLRAVPRDEVTPKRLAEFDTILSRRSVNQEQAKQSRNEQREEAMGRFVEHLASKDLSQALRDAVEVQTLSPDMAAVLDEDAFVNVIASARHRIPEVLSENDWLHAQELLYRLRTLYEDTGLNDLYNDCNAELGKVNERVGLLARYAPRALHDLRQKQAARLGEEPLGDFNPAFQIDWRERLENISPNMLRSSLRMAAREHIESDGYKPLMLGGIDALRLLATTQALSETFTELSDHDKVEQWIRFLDDRTKRIEQMKKSDIDSLILSRLLDSLVEENEKILGLPRALIYREFGDGAMGELDRFSQIVWPDEVRRFRQSVEGNFVGVGILIRQNDTREIMVVNPLEGAPAYFAGIKPDDIIAEVNGEPTFGWTTNDAVDKITGEANTPVTLGIKRAGEEDLLPIEIVRDVVKIHSVKGWEKEGLTDGGDPIWNWYVDPVSEIAYIRLTQFTDDSFNDLLDAWDEINAQGNPKGLIFDLRYNPGGLLDAAVQISNLFVAGGPVVSGEDKLGRQVWELSAQRHRAAWKGVPSVVLINKGSASASEIVSGALQAHGAALVVGERSFGKGSVQSVLPITADSRLKLTTQYFRLPGEGGRGKGRLIHHKPDATEWGVMPDIEVVMTPSQVLDSITLQREAELIGLDDDGNPMLTDDSRPDINRLLIDGLDPQLETALLILQARAMGEAAGEVRHASSR